MKCQLENSFSVKKCFFACVIHMSVDLNGIICPLLEYKFLGGKGLVFFHIVVFSKVFHSVLSMAL